MTYGILVDTTRCSYCDKCIPACQERHNNENPGTFYTDVTLTYPRGTTERALAVPTLCMHCLDAPCVKVCQGKALSQTPDGPVTWDADRCIGCLSCVGVCPFAKSLHYDESKNKVFKCDMCYDRITAGEKPACVEICDALGYHARVFGLSDEVLEEGRTKAKEIGGVLLYPGKTHVLTLIKETDFAQPMMEQLFHLSADYPLTARIKASAAQYARLGWVAVAVGVALSVLRWRDNKMKDLVRVKGDEET